MRLEYGQENRSVQDMARKIRGLGHAYRQESLVERPGILTEIGVLVEQLVPFSFNTDEEENPQEAHFSPLAVPVKYLKNVGPKRADLLKKLGIRNAAELLEFFPKRYEDRRKVKKISHLQPGEVETVRGRLGSMEEFRPRSNLSITKVWISDDTGSIPAVWFNQRFIKRQLEKGREIVVYGKVEKKFAHREILVQDYEVVDQGDSLLGDRIVPIYRTTEKISQKLMRKIMFAAAELYVHQIQEFLPRELTERRKLMERSRAVRAMHFPESPEEQKSARHRLAFEELLLLQLGILKGTGKKTETGIRHFRDAGILKTFQQALPFQMTSAQKRVIAEVYQDMEASVPMARLVQGDVGSGKTVVAAAALYKAAVSGYQGAMMAPTEILAQQHYQSLCSMLGGLGVQTALATGSMKLREREVLYREIQKGNYHVVVGTHALIQEGVVFKNLSLAVTDEQHRFGVLQRAGLEKKGAFPDVLVMTATPIPRTLALTLYGDLNLSVIDQIPPGRKEIKTYAVQSSLEDRVLKFIAREIRAGRQAYIVCPLVEESEKIDLQAAKELAELLEEGIFQEFSLALLHGRMKSGEKDEVMERFRTGKIQILIATTVVEVGINVPNATVMLVRDAERFGLAQLHQLRGRIGRGAHQSYCILMHNAKSPEARERMKIMESTNDGFQIAEADLSLRGPGDFFGTRQHGLPELKVANIFADAHLLEQARGEALKILAEDPDLSTSAYQELGRMVQEKFKILN